MKERNFNAIPFIIILILLIMGLSGYIVYDKFLSNNSESIENNNNNDENNDINKAGVINLDLSSDLVKDLSSKVINNYSVSSIYFYERDKIIIEDEPMSFKLALASELAETKSLGSDCQNNKEGIIYIEEQELVNAYYEIFGSEVKYEKVSSFYRSRYCSAKYNWSSINNRYEAKGVCGCGGGGPMDGPVTQLAYAKQEKNNEETKVELYEYFALSIWDDEESKYKYYSDYNKTNFIGLDVYNSKIDFFNKYSEQLGLYKYTFVQDNNGTYVFTSVERVK